VDPHYRELFNAQFTPERYAWYQRELSRRLDATFEFRLAETPLFLPDDLKAKLVDSAQAILAQLSEPEKLEKMKRAIPERWNTPGMDRLPNFTQIDFAIVAEGEGWTPKLIELQGFPSLTSLQCVQRDTWRDTLAKMDGLNLNWSCWYNGLDRDAFLSLARRTIVGEHDPYEVILMDLDPPRQKTYPDFSATRRLFGVSSYDPTRLRRSGRQLYLPDGTRVRRIYNRVVFDELQNKGTELPFDYRDDLDVEWAPHPNWYWTWSKYSLPFLDLRGRRRERRADRGRPRAHPAGGARGLVHPGEDRIRPGTEGRGRRGREDRDPDDVPPPRRRADTDPRPEPRTPLPRQDARRRLQQAIHLGRLVGGAVAIVVKRRPEDDQEGDRVARIGAGSAALKASRSSCACRRRSSRNTVA